MRRLSARPGLAEALGRLTMIISARWPHHVRQDDHSPDQSCGTPARWPRRWRPG